MPLLLLLLLLMVTGTWLDGGPEVKLAAGAAATAWIPDTAQ